MKTLFFSIIAIAYLSIVGAMIMGNAKLATDISLSLLTLVLVYLITPKRLYSN